MSTKGSYILSSTDDIYPVHVEEVYHVYCNGVISCLVQRRYNLSGREDIYSVYLKLYTDEVYPIICTQKRYLLYIRSTVDV